MSSEEFAAMQKRVMDVHSSDQQAVITQRNAEIGQAARATVEMKWPDLIQRVASEIAKGTSPSDPAAKDLASEWNELLSQFTGGDEAIKANLGKMYATAPEKAAAFGTVPTVEMIEFISKASK